MLTLLVLGHILRTNLGEFPNPWLGVHYDDVFADPKPAVLQTCHSLDVPDCFLAVRLRLNLLGRNTVRPSQARIRTHEALLLSAAPAAATPACPCSSHPPPPKQGGAEETLTSTHGPLSLRGC